MVDFEANEDHTMQTKIEVLRKIQSNYGNISLSCPEIFRSGE